MGFASVKTFLLAGEVVSVVVDCFERRLRGVIETSLAKLAETVVVFFTAAGFFVVVFRALRDEFSSDVLTSFFLGTLNNSLLDKVSQLSDYDFFE